MDVEHDTPAGVVIPLALVVVGPHLDPLGLERAVGLPPLPPLPPADLADAVRAQLGLEHRRCMGDLVVGDLNLLDLDPLRMRHPLGRESLELLDRVV